MTKLQRVNKIWVSGHHQEWNKANCATFLKYIQYVINIQQKLIYNEMKLACHSICILIKLVI